MGPQLPCSGILWYYCNSRPTACFLTGRSLRRTAQRHTVSGPRKGSVGTSEGTASRQRSSSLSIAGRHPTISLSYGEGHRLTSPSIPSSFGVTNIAAVDTQQWCYLTSGQWAIHNEVNSPSSFLRTPASPRSRSDFAETFADNDRSDDSDSYEGVCNELDDEEDSLDSCVDSPDTSRSRSPSRYRPREQITNVSK